MKMKGLVFIFYALVFTSTILALSLLSGTAADKLVSSDNELNAIALNGSILQVELALATAAIVFAIIGAALAIRQAIENSKTTVK
jgi:ABC-type multidrug transport system permease subunit